MSDPDVTQAARKLLPLAGVAVTAGNGANATTDLSALKGKWVTLKAPGKTHFRAGPSVSVAAATTDWWLEAGEERDFLVTEDRMFLGAWGVGGAHACVAAETGT